MWRDLGLIFEVAGQAPWMASHAYVPTALVLPDRIRVFAAFWDDASVGRLGYVDVSREDPTSVVGHAAHPVLDVGSPGAFDEHGVTPMSVQKIGDQVLLHYAGWQRSEQVRYLLFTGLAVSWDDGSSFTRARQTPVLDRSDRHFLVRTGFMLREEEGWKGWIAQSDGLIDNGGKPTPTYGMHYLESPDGFQWPDAGTPCFSTTPGDIFGYGRSAIWREGEEYRGLFSVRRMTGGYRIESSRSPDGRTWTPLSTSDMAFLPQHTITAERETMFPSVVRCDGRLIMFYNGDDFGRRGVHAALWAA